MQLSEKKLEALADALSTSEKKYFLANFKDWRGYMGWRGDIDAGIWTRETAGEVLAVFGLRYWSGPFLAGGYLRGVRIAIERNISGPCATLFEKVYEYSPEERKQWMLDEEAEVEA